MSVQKLVEAAKESNFSEFQKVFMEEFSHIDLAEAYRLRSELAEQEIVEKDKDKKDDEDMDEEYDDDDDKKDDKDDKEEDGDD